MTFSNAGLDAVLNRGEVSSLECPTMISRPGEPPSMAIIEQLAIGQCRIRSVAQFADGDMLEMPISVPGAPKMTIKGRVASHVPNGARSSYVLTLARFSILERADFEKLLVAATQYAARHATKEVPVTVSGLTRTSPRVPIDVDVRYRVGGRDSRIARATNISAGGIQMKSAEAVPTGSAIELRLTLPGSAGALEIPARIVAQQPNAAGGFNYNIAFHNVPEAAREQIARYVTEKLVAN